MGADNSPEEAYEDPAAERNHEIVKEYGTPPCECFIEALNRGLGY
jgi:hypothetical protein